MVPSRDRCAPLSEHTDALLQRSQQRQSRIGHAKSDCPLHQAREASSLSAIHRARHIASLAILRVLCCDHQALSESQQVIRHRLARLPPCFCNTRVAVVYFSPRLLCRFDLALSANSTSWRIASEREGLSGCCFAQVSIADLSVGERRIADTGSLPVAGRPRFLFGSTFFVDRDCI